MKQLDYCHPLLGYIVYPSENQIFKRKIRMLYDLNHIQKCLGKGPLSPKQFDDLYESSLTYLASIINDQASLLSITL